MSSILKRINYDIKGVVDALMAFDIVLKDENTKPDIGLENKTVLDVNSEQGLIIKKYSYATAEAKALLDFVDMSVRRKKTELHKNLIENSSHSFTDREREKLFDDDEEYVNMQILYLEVKERYDKFRGLLDAISSRGYALNNIAKLMVEHVEHTVL